MQCTIVKSQYFYKEQNASGLLSQLENMQCTIVKSQYFYQRAKCKWVIKPIRKYVTPPITSENRRNSQ